MGIEIMTPSSVPQAVLGCLEQKLKTQTCTWLLRSLKMNPGPPEHRLPSLTFSDYTQFLHAEKGENLRNLKGKVG